MLSFLAFFQSHLNKVKGILLQESKESLWPGKKLKMESQVQNAGSSDQAPPHKHFYMARTQRKSTYRDYFKNQVQCHLCFVWENAMG